LTRDAGFIGRDGAALVSFDGALYMLGGWNSTRKDLYGPAATNNEVWRSTDGIAWEYLCSAPWAPRHTYGCVVCGGMIWIVGGDCNAGSYTTDIWKSPDGVNWELVMECPPWGPRVLHHTLVHDGKIWVMGGQSGSMMIKGEPDMFYNDVWYSDDGINWKLACAHAPWPERGMIGGSAVLNGKMWILGGGLYDTPERSYRQFYTDIWSSANGAEWELETRDAGWPVRQYHDVAAFDGRLWVLAGYGADEYDTRAVPVGDMLARYKNRNDVWHSTDGRNWAELTNTPWAPRHASGVCVHNNALWVVSGNNFDADVWRLSSRDL